jgi:hypothetical protein
MGPTRIQGAAYGLGFTCHELLTLGGKERKKARFRVRFAKRSHKKKNLAIFLLNTLSPALIKGQW